MDKAETPEEIELAKAENNKKIAEAKLAEETAKKSLKELYYPKSETKGLEGAITASDSAGYIAELLAYESLCMATDKAAKNIDSELNEKKVILSTSFDIGDQYALWNVLDTRADVVIQQLETLKTQFNRSKDPTTRESVLPAIAAAPAILGAVTDIAKFFKVDREIKSRKVTLSNNALIAAAAASIKKQCNPGDISIHSLDFKTRGALSAKLDTILAKYDEIIALNAKFKTNLESTQENIASIQKKIEQKQKEITNATDTAQKEQLKKEIKKLQNDELPFIQLELKLKTVEKLATETIAATKAFRKSLTERSGDKLSLLEKVREIDYLKGNDDAILLLIEISSAGGEYETSKGSLFKSSKISYLGAVVLSYVLIDKNHNYVSSGVIPVKKGAQYKSLTK